MTERVDPPKSADEKTMLSAYLDYHRATLVMKVAGLTDEQAKFSPVPSGTSLVGLLTHLRWVEQWWFTAVIADEDDAWFPWSDDDPDGDWRVPSDATVASLL